MRGTPYGIFEMDTFIKMKDFEHVVAVKWSNPKHFSYEEMRRLTDSFNILDNNGTPGSCFKNGGHGFLDDQVLGYPPHDLKVLSLLRAGKYDEGQALWDSVSKPLGQFHGRISKRSGGQSRLKKGVMAIMGHPVGSMRPPSQPLDKEEEAELRALLIGFGWPVPAKPAKVAIPA
jgi:dihydrodipicolinate synthase/N-acetylneuraminate lyase